jgi:hypothetical protein
MMQGQTLKMVFTSWVFYLYCFMIIFLCCYSYKKQAYNWDILPYMAIVLSHNNNDINKIHQEVYTIAENEIPEAIYKKLIDSTNLYRKDVAKSPAELHLQLPFYAVKPLYTLACSFFYKAGFSITKSTVLPSIVSYFFIAVLLFTWIKKYYSWIFTFITSALVMLSPPVLLTAQLSTPDCMSGLLLFASIYFFVEKKSFVFPSLILLLSIFVRLDNILPAVLICSIVYYTQKKSIIITSKKHLLLLVGMVLSYFFVTYTIYSYGWGIFYYPVFITHLNPFYDIHRSFSFTDYTSVVKSQLMTGLYYSFLVSYLLLAFVFLNKSFTNNKITRVTIEQFLCWTFLVIIALRFVLQPVISDRFYFAYYLSTLVFVLKNSVRIF